MRAFTSLAGHILGTHPRINGYFEMHLGYEDVADLEKQLEVLQQSETLKANSHYIFDKLLHNEYLLKPEQLGAQDIRILVALRQPEPSIKSIVNLFAQREADALYASPEAAANYYIKRLQWLAEYCRTTAQPYLYFDAELLQGAPEKLLPELSRWLQLEPPLTERYDIFSQTGTARKGDSSALIKSGKISPVRQDYSHIGIPETLLLQAHAVYSACREEILQRAAISLTR